MLEALPGVQVRHVRGQFSFNNVIQAIVRFSFDDSNGKGKMVLAGQEFTVSPRDYPLFMELKTITPPYIVEGTVSGQGLTVDPGDSDVEAVVWYIHDYEALRGFLLHELGTDSVADLLGALNASVKNLTPIPAIVKARW